MRVGAVPGHDQSETRSIRASAPRVGQAAYRFRLERSMKVNELERAEQQCLPHLPTLVLFFVSGRLVAMDGPDATASGLLGGAQPTTSGAADRRIGRSARRSSRRWDAWGRSKHLV